MKTWRAKLEVFFSPYAAGAIQDAKAFIKYHGFTDEDVAIIHDKKTQQVIIRTLREVTPRQDENSNFLDYLKECGIRIH